MIKLYKKKPIPVEVFHFDGTTEGLKELKDFAGAAIGIHWMSNFTSQTEVQILTLEDGKYLTCKHIATAGDYIIKGSFGEFWPVKPHIFKETYEEV